MRRTLGHVGSLQTYPTSSFHPTAIRNDRLDLAKLLLGFGSNVNLEGCHSRTPLHEAAKLGREDFVELLLRSGADPDARSDYGLTPLALAAQCGHVKVVQALVQKGTVAYVSGSQTVGWAWVPTPQNYIIICIYSTS